jgi:glutamine---fructose-6-phosphate transaminase (isomerizing)
MPKPHPVYQDIQNQGDALRQTLDFQLGPGWSNLERAAQAIRNATQITVASIGASYSASLPFVYRLGAAGKPAALVDASELLHYTNSTAQPGSVFILASRSGETIEIVRLLQVLKGRAGTIIGVTNEPESPLARLSDIPILLGCPRDHLIAIQTYSATLLTLLIMAELILRDVPIPDMKQIVGSLPGLVESSIGEYSRVSQDWAGGFRQYGGVYLLARGPSRASANQAALLFHEMARYPAAAWTIGEFRHGPWEVMDERICAFVFMPEDQTQALNEAFAVDLAEMGGDVRVISAGKPKSLPGNLSIWAIPPVDPSLAPILEIIPVQFFIYEYSRWQGLTPGEFRASTPVTLSEAGRLNIPDT